MGKRWREAAGKQTSSDLDGEWHLANYRSKGVCMCVCECVCGGGVGSFYSKDLKRMVFKSQSLFDRKGKWSKLVIETTKTLKNNRVSHL